MRFKALFIGVAALTLAATVAVALAATSAGSRSIVLGKTPHYPESGCPQPERCQVVARVTGIQMKADGIDRPFVAPSDGRIISWWLKLPKLRPSYVKSFSDLFGGPPSARVSVLRRGTQGRLRLIHQSAIEPLTQHLGEKGRTRFKLATPLSVKKGDYIGLSAVTWTPSFVVGLGSDSDNWLASRPKSRCDTPGSSDPDRFAAYYKKNDAHLRERTAKEYKCLYRTARLMYWARFVPKASKASIVLGKTLNYPEPRCPGARGCQVAAHVTGIQIWADGTSHSFIAPQDGKVVSWWLQLPRVQKKVISALSKTFGGPPQARLAIVRRPPNGHVRLLRQSGVRKLAKHLAAGGHVEFTLKKPLAIKKGDYIGLTALTWTPSFVSGLSSETDAWLASRPKSRCSVPPRSKPRRFTNYFSRNEAQIDVGTVKLYECFYQTSRLMYGASMAPAP